VGFYSAIRREVPIRTFNDWKDPPPGFCEIDMVAHGGTSVAGSFIQTLTLVDVATGWTECLPLIARDGGLVVEAIKRVQRLLRDAVGDMSAINFSAAFLRSAHIRCPLARGCGRRCV
jgi:hypothetical protein